MTVLDRWADLSPHRSADARVNGVRLNYLAWGGIGPPVVLIHGLGGNPHAFDDLAPWLRERCRVLAYARRGHGDSESPTGGYDLDTLVEDLRQLLDHLGIERASLLGWSTGGNEITRFADLHPERVERLVYLDAGYDWSDPAFHGPFLSMLAESVPDAAATESIDAYRTWYRAGWVGEAPWTTGLEAYLRDTVRVGDDGRVRAAMPAAVADALLAALAGPRRDYTRVRAPALALYATSFFPSAAGDPARRRRVHAWEEGVMAPFRRASMERVRRELPGARVRQLADTTHMSIGVEHPEALGALIGAFLAPTRPGA